MDTGAGCQTYQLTFWYFMSSDPVFDIEPMRFLLEVKKEYIQTGLQSNVLIWGSRDDYLSSYVAGEWNLAVVQFEANGRFNLHFFAHHNDKCQSDIRAIAIHAIRLEQGGYQQFSRFRS